MLKRLKQEIEMYVEISNKLIGVEAGFQIMSILRSSELT